MEKLLRLLLWAFIVQHLRWVDRYQNAMVFATRCTASKSLRLAIGKLASHHVNMHVIERRSNLQLLIGVHQGTRALFTVAQSYVGNNELVFHDMLQAYFGVPSNGTPCLGTLTISAIRIQAFNAWLGLWGTCHSKNVSRHGKDVKFGTLKQAI